MNRGAPALLSCVIPMAISFCSLGEGSNGGARGLVESPILQRYPRRVQDRTALRELLFHLCVRRSQHFARDRSGGQERLHQMADVGKVLDRRVGVAVTLKYDRLALVRVEEDFVLQRAAILGPHDLHGFFRQALPFLDLAGMKSYSCDSFDLVHWCSVSRFRLNGFGTC